MNINVTIVFQAFCFFISYCFLKNFFFAPLFATLQRHEAKKQSLEQDVSGLQRKKYMLEEEKKLQWLHIVHTLKSYIPFGALGFAQKDITCPLLSQRVKHVAPNQQEQQKVVAHLVEKLSGHCHDTKH